MLFLIVYGTVSPFGWGMVVFLDTMMGFLILKDVYPEFTDGRRGDWLNPAIAVPWLVVCLLGPFFGFFITDIKSFPPTESNWHWRYLARVILSVVIPVIAALPMTLNFSRTLKTALIQIMLLVCITALPVWTGVNSMRDLIRGPVSQRQQRDCVYHKDDDICICEGSYISCDGPSYKAWKNVVLLPHTGRVLKATVE